MSFTAELQRQFPVGDVPAGAVERSGILSALTLAEHKVGIRRAA